MSALSRLLDGNWLYNVHLHTYHFYIHKSNVQFSSQWWSVFNAQRAMERQTDYRQCLSQLTHVEDSRGSVTATGGPGVSPDRLKRLLEEAEMSSRAGEAVESLPLSELRSIAQPHYGLSQYAYHLGNENMGYFQNPPATVVLWLQLPQQSREFIIKSLTVSGVDTAGLFASDPLVGFVRLPMSILVQIIRQHGEPITAVTIPCPGPALTPLNQSELPEANRINSAHGVVIGYNLQTLAKYAEYTAWPVPKARVPPQNPMVTVIGNTSDIPPRRADVLQRIATQGHQDIIADYDWQIARPLTLTELNKPLAHSVSAALNSCSSETDSSWHRCKSGIIVDRDNRWYRDEKLNVSNDYLTGAMRSQVAITKLNGNERQIATLAFDTKIWRDLTPWQFMNGFKWAELPPQPGKPAELAFGTTYTQIRQSWPAIDFAVTLSATDQRALVTGGVRLSSLSATQLQILQKYYPRLLYLSTREYRSHVVKVEEAHDAVLQGTYMSLIPGSSITRFTLTVVRG